MSKKDTPKKDTPKKPANDPLALAVDLDEDHLLRGSLFGQS